MSCPEPSLCSSGPGKTPLYAVPVSHVWGEVKQPVEVFRGRRPDFVFIDFEQLSQDARRFCHGGRLIALAAAICGSQPRSVRFHQYAIQRQPGGYIAQRLSFGIRKIAGKGDEKSQIERPPRFLPSAAEAVHDAAQAGGLPMLFEDLEEMVPGIGRVIFRPAVDQDGPLACRRDLELADQSLALHIVRSTFMVIVETDLTAGDDLGLCQQ